MALLADPVWRLNNLYSIADKNQEIIPFVMNVAQRDFQKNAHWRDIILKSRQWWFTTYCVVLGFDTMTTRPNTNCLFIAHKKDEADAILKNKVPVLWNNYRVKDKLYYEVQTDQAWEFRIWFSPNDPSINSFIKTSLSWVSGTYHYMHVSEFALIERMRKGASDEIIRWFAAVPPDGKIIIESTARWAYGTYHEMFMQAWERTQSWLPLGPTEWKGHFYNWFLDPEVQHVQYIIPVNKMKEAEFFRQTQMDYKLNDKQINWFYNKYLQLKSDKNILLSEYPRSISDAFRASSNAYFNQELLDLQPTRPPIAVQGWWKAYAIYDKTHKYCLGADPAGGKGGDNATIVIIDVTARSVCAEYCNAFTTPAQLADEINKVGGKYGYCLAGVERNNHGHAVLERLKSLNYPNIYAQLNRNEMDDKETKELGFLTTRTSKPIILSNLSQALNDFSLLVVSETIKAELSVFPRDASDMVDGDEEVWHFDRVMALAIAWEVRKYLPSDSILVTS